MLKLKVNIGLTNITNRARAVARSAYAYLGVQAQRSNDHAEFHETSMLKSTPNDLDPPA